MTFSDSPEFFCIALRIRDTIVISRVSGGYGDFFEWSYKMDTASQYSQEQNLCT